MGRGIQAELSARLLHGCAERRDVGPSRRSLAYHELSGKPADRVRDVPRTSGPQEAAAS